MLLSARIAIASAVGAATLTGPGTAHAASSFTCSSVLGNGGIVATVCTDILSGQVRGRLTPLAGGVTVDSLTLYECNAAETSCTTLAETTTLTTPSFAATTGKHYETCAFFHVRETPTQVVHYTGCSPFAVA
ncbi:hypothetical protein GCM10023195_05040 [Actinoallomurus liliacearum]|uniref:Secreted protein n=1 Tax=Actinoallomurus liliacearum TaxID=1080073 RepID=A0ABP8T9P5_9ACTN